MSNPCNRPDLELARRRPNGTTVSYGHVYWRPLIVHILGRTIIRTSRRSRA